MHPNSLANLNGLKGIAGPGRTLGSKSTYTIKDLVDSIKRVEEELKKATGSEVKYIDLLVKMSLKEPTLARAMLDRLVPANQYVELSGAIEVYGNLSEEALIKQCREAGISIPAAAARFTQFPN